SEEAATPLELAELVRSQPGHVASLVFDDRVATDASDDPFIEHVVLPRAGRRGSTPTDLAKQLELDATGLEQAVSESGTGRARALEPPFRAIRVTGSRPRTPGRLLGDARPPGPDGSGQPIARLYAAGGVTAALATSVPTVGRAGLDALLALGLGRVAALDVIAEVARRDDESNG